VKSEPDTSEENGSMFRRSNMEGFKTVLEGIRMKTLVHGERTLMAEFRFDKGALVPVHTHPHEQTGCVVSGVMKFIIDGEVLTARAGDSWNLPSNVPHGAEALEESVVIEVFSPVREDYLSD
jgi:quercetin dioxygenase-like cupin family protein